MSQELRPHPQAQLRSLQKLIPRLKIARVLSLPEENFGQMILSIERHPLFQKFSQTDNTGQQLFSFRRFPRSGLTAGFLELNEETAGGSGGGVDVETLLNEKRDLIQLCQRIGRQNFETYFIDGGEGRSPETIGKACGLSVEDTRRLLDLTTQIGVHAEFYTTPTTTPEWQTRFSCIAHIEQDNGGFVVRYTSLRYGRGRYTIDYEKLRRARTDPDLSPTEKKALVQLVASMELINARRSTVHQILEMITERQKTFLSSGREEDRADLTQDELAERMGVHPSTVCRAVAGKSLLTPWHRERPLRDFLGRGSVHGVLAELERLLEEEDKDVRSGKRRRPWRDQEIKGELHRRRGWTLAVRTIAKYRSLIDVPNIYERAKGYKLNPSAPNKTPLLLQNPPPRDPLL